MTCGSVGNGDLIKVDKTFTVGTTASSIGTMLLSASSSITSQVNANTNSQVAAVNTAVANASSSLAVTVPYAVWNATTRSLTTFGTLVSDVATAVWSAGTKTLTGFGTLAADVWTNGTRTLTGANLGSGSLATLSDVQNASSSIVALVNGNTNNQATTVNTTITTASSSLGSLIQALGVNTGVWVVQMSDGTAYTGGGTYRAKVTVLNYTSTPTTPASVPTITLYDPNRNVVVSSVAMTQLSTGVYEYTYSIATGATQGVWEAVATTQVEAGKNIQTNDYWEVRGAPAQVLIQSMASTEVPNVAANVRITNEGSIDYEYKYEWCVVTNISNTCGGGDDTYYASAAKLIAVGANFDTQLVATVPSAGTYYFKVVVYFGTESSGSSRQFTATSGPSGGGNTGGGDGGGGGSLAPVVAPPIPLTGSSSCKGADLNGDGRVNTIDFSILLSFWKRTPPFKNPCVDINHDNKVDARDFSIMLAQWGTRGKVIPGPGP
jgi:ABC-type transporter Mla MlaB component